MVFPVNVPTASSVAGVEVPPPLRKSVPEEVLLPLALPELEGVIKSTEGEGGVERLVRNAGLGEVTAVDEPEIEEDALAEGNAGEYEVEEEGE